MELVQAFAPFSLCVARCARVEEPSARQRLVWKTGEAGAGSELWTWRRFGSKLAEDPLEPNSATLLLQGPARFRGVKRQKDGWTSEHSPIRRPRGRPAPVAQLCETIHGYSSSYVCGTRARSGRHLAVSFTCPKGLHVLYTRICRWSSSTSHRPKSAFLTKFRWPF